MKVERVSLPLDGVDDEVRVVPLASRLSGLAVLGVVLTILVTLGVQGADAFRDAWVAPLHLAPEQEPVLMARARLAEEEARFEQLIEEALAAEASIAAIDEAREKLEALSKELSSAFASESSRATGEADTARAELAAANAGLRILQSMMGSAEADVQRTRHAREAGLVTQLELEASERLRDQAHMALESGRQRARLASFVVSTTQVRATALSGLPASGIASSAPVVRESFEAVERRARIELEVARLVSERRALETGLRLARTNAATLGGILQDLRARPLYRAISAPIDVAFVPYDQLDDVRARARVMRCIGGLVLCHEVGRVVEVLAGEVVTEGPFGERQRGQYAVIQLSDPGAHRETTLRIRR